MHAYTTSSSLEKYPLIATVHFLARSFSFFLCFEFFIYSPIRLISGKNFLPSVGCFSFHCKLFNLWKLHMTQSLRKELPCYPAIFICGNIQNNKTQLSMKIRAYHDNCGTVHKNQWSHMFINTLDSDSHREDEVVISQEMNEAVGHMLTEMSYACKEH